LVLIAAVSHKTHYVHKNCTSRNESADNVTLLRDVDVGRERSEPIERVYKQIPISMSRVVILTGKPKGFFYDGTKTGSV